MSTLHVVDILNNLESVCKCYSLDLLKNIQDFLINYLIKNHNPIYYNNYYCTSIFLLCFTYIWTTEILLKLLSEFAFIFFKETFV